jgi:hypothetical protein
LTAVVDGRGPGAIRSDGTLELGDGLEAEPFDPLGHLLVDLGVLGDDLLAIGLLQLHALIDEPGEDPPRDLIGVHRGDVLLVLLGPDGEPLLQLADDYLGRHTDGTWAPDLETNAVISCVDRPDPKPRSAARELADVARFQSELPPWGGGWAVSGCAGMPKPARGDKLGDVRVTGSAPILVVGTTGDPATPYAGAFTMVSRIAGSGLLTFESTEHTGYGTGRSTCIDDAVDAYLIDGVMPAAGTQIFTLSCFWCNSE